MFTIKTELQFRVDYQQTMRKYPQLKEEFEFAIRELMEHGTVPEEYHPHTLDNLGGNYNNHVDFHLSDGHLDILVLYMPHKTNPIIRLVRMGDHDELFQGPLK